jgi:thiopurine S-methyltransferase
MDLNFWQDRWENDETGFHQTGLNPYLAYFYGEKGPAIDARSSLKIFVPLCGKSMDMHWLSENGYSVVGVECSPIAVKEFVKNHGVSIEETKNDRHARYVINADSPGNAGIDLIQGDYFGLTKADVEGVTDVFDRASLIALPEDMRKSYADKMTELTSPGVRMLLITMTYPQHEMDGPPFSVSEEEVHDLYDESFKIEKLLIKNILSNEKRFQERGLTSLIETAYKLTRK